MAGPGLLDDRSSPRDEAWARVWRHGGDRHRMDDLPHRPPVTLDALLRRTRELGLDAACESRTGGLLCVLAASKPGGRLLELGTGTGVGTAWLLDGMDSAAS